MIWVIDSGWHTMFIPKPRPTNLRVETVAKKELADELLAKQVERIIFDFHMPYLLKADCPVKQPIRGLDGGHIAFVFSKVDKTTTYSDKHEIKGSYTLIRTTLDWDEPRPSLANLMREPLAVLTEFPLHFINGLVNSYQFITSDYTGRHIGPMELEYVPGEIWLVGDPEPLKIVTHHQRADRELPQFDSEMWLYYSWSLLHDSPKWLGAKLLNDARRASHEHVWKKVFIDAVTCIEVMSTEVWMGLPQAIRHSGQLRKARGLRKILLTGIPKHPQLASRIRAYTTAATDWLSHVYVLRNRIVHSGHSEVWHDDVAKALNLTGALARILDELIPDAENGC